MNHTLTSVSTQHSALLPIPELPIKVRLGTMEDIPFIDELQKKNNKSLGFMFRKALEGKVKREEVLIAEEVVSSELPVVSEDTGKPDFGTGGVPTVAPRSVLTTHYSPLTTKVGYLIGNDRYFKRDELGAIFQLCVVPGKRRGLVGATLLKSLFGRSSYGCKLYCCWCAQDLEANHFWEAMGFVPVAFRTGSRNKNKRQDGKKSARIHIYWQKRIRAGDTTTSWWYPHQTGGGSIEEDRIVLPIPPGVHWSEVEHEELPGEENVDRGLLNVEADAVGESTGENLPQSAIDSPQSKKKRKANPQSTIHDPQSNKKQPFTLQCGQAIYFAPPVVEAPKSEKVKAPKVKAPKVKQKNDPTKVKAARELRDRYLEEINRNPTLVSNGKYEVSRLVQSTPSHLTKLLAA